MNEKYEQLKKVIQEANPEISRIVRCDNCADGFTTAYATICNECDGAGEFRETRPIRLADVLLAMQVENSGHYYVRSDGTFFTWEKFIDGGSGYHGVKSTYINWRLSNDNLAHQSDDTKQYLIDLLVKWPLKKNANVKVKETRNVLRSQLPKSKPVNHSNAAGTNYGNSENSPKNYLPLNTSKHYANSSLEGERGCG